MPYNTVVLKGYPMRKEAIANESITPGHLLNLNSSGKLIKHAGAAKSASAMFAIENEVWSNTNAFGTIDTAYGANYNVLYGIFQPGDEVYALVAAGASAIVVGDLLESAGDGTLRKVATDSATSQDERRADVARALTAVDNSGGSAAVRIVVEIL